MSAPARIKVTIQVKREPQPRVNVIELIEGQVTKLNPAVLADAMWATLELEPEPATDEPDK